MSETVSSDIRDKVIEKALRKEGNSICFDCGSKAPKWASPYLGIFVCYECAARHRSYGTHISFIRSVNLDKWNRKQLKSIELGGNNYTKEQFNSMGIPLIGGTYDYNNPLVIKFREKLANLVKENLGENEYREGELPEQKKKDKKKVENNENDEATKGKSNDETNEISNEVDTENTDGITNKKSNTEKEETVEEPKKLEITTKVKVNDIKVEKKGGKKNKIKKVDFDFDFESFNDVNFNDLANNKEESEEKPNQKTDDDIQKEEEEKENKKEGNSYSIKLTKEEINKKFANKKAISSEDYAALENDGESDSTINSRIKQYNKADAISSSDIYGNENVYESSEGIGSKLKDFAFNLTLGAAEKAKELKNKANDLINKVQTKLGY